MLEDELLKRFSAAKNYFLGNILQAERIETRKHTVADIKNIKIKLNYQYEKHRPPSNKREKCNFSFSLNLFFLG